MIEPVKNEIYLVKITNKDHMHYGIKVKVKFTGIVMRSLYTQNYLYEDEYEIIEKTEMPVKPPEEKGLFDKETVD